MKTRIEVHAGDLLRLFEAKRNADGKMFAIDISTEPPNADIKNQVKI